MRHAVLPFMATILNIASLFISSSNLHNLPLEEREPIDHFAGAKIARDLSIIRSSIIRYENLGALLSTDISSAICSNAGFSAKTTKTRTNKNGLFVETTERFELRKYPADIRGYCVLFVNAYMPA